MRIWDTTTKEVVGIVALSSWIRTVKFSPKGDLIAIGCGIDWDRQVQISGFSDKPGEILIVDFPSLKERSRIQENSGVYDLGFSSDGKMIVSTSYSSYLQHKSAIKGIVKIWDKTTGKVKHKLKIFGDDFIPVSFTPNGENVVVGDCLRRSPGDPQIMVTMFDVTSGKKKYALPEQRSKIDRIGFLPTGKDLVLLSGYQILICDAVTGQDKTPWELTKVFSQNVDFALSSDSKYLVAIGSVGGGPNAKSWVSIWNFVKKEGTKIPWPEQRVILTCIAFSPDSSSVAIGTSNGKIIILKIAK